MAKRKSFKDLLGERDERVRDALTALLPSHWKKARLTVSYHPVDNRRFIMPHTIGCLDGNGEAILDTDPKYDLDELYGATHDHFALCQKHKKMWRQARFTVRRLVSGAWKYTSEFSY
jgi:hypothetical protein